MGALSGGNACLKYLVFIFNFLFFLVGCGLVGIGIYGKTGRSDYIDLAETISTESKYITAANLMLAVGVIVLVVAFLGCCGACMENECMLLAFFILLAIIFILELAVGIYGLTNRSKIEDQLQKDFEDAINNKYENKTNSPIKETIDKFQVKFECCGYNGWRDWKNSTYFRNSGYIPGSCCRDQDSSTCPTKTDRDEYYQAGCFKKVVVYLKDNVTIVGTVGIAFAFIQILGLVFSMLLYCAIKRANSGTLA